MPVSISQRCRLSGVGAAAVRCDARRLLASLGEARASLGVRLVGDEEMRRLNRDYRGLDHPTDVLAFAMREGRRAPGDGAELGDVVISLPAAARQARHRRVALAREVRTLLVHGVLHLLGYDHERSPAEAQRMRAMERRLLVALSIGETVRPGGMRDGAAGARKRSRSSSSKGKGTR